MKKNSKEKRKVNLIWFWFAEEYTAQGFSNKKGVSAPVKKRGKRKRVNFIWSTCDFFV